VLDAETRLPIKGAKISFDESPHHPTYSDRNGYFRMKARKNFHWGGNAAGGSWPFPKQDDMGITHEGYVARGGRWAGNLGDILLKPKPPSDH
jgi:hypothetical protein